ncbi:unnamed protein product [Anisakis simplex]|uniref:PAX3-and PAX7-binding protein 1 n=1 Tax=Anisakis simplex TaxID=6269 RepID=A0A0M3JZP0_ANISI|nr:unnamed protein product [Anisakis simplex]
MADQFEEVESICEAAIASTSSTSTVNVTKAGGMKRRLSSWVDGVDDQPEESFKEKEKQGEEPANADVSSPLSPQSMQKSETDSFSERRSSAEEQVKSPTSSITDLKRLSASSTQDALSNTLRTKIREETKSKINQKRESIQLTKRLQRSKSQVIDDEPLSDIDQDSLDAQIEQSLQLGSKFVQDKEDNRLPSATVQYDFLTATYKDENADEESDAAVFYGRARPQCRNDLEKFHTLCTSYDKRNAPASTDAENGLPRLHCTGSALEAIYST